jgi:hypothetical protein
MEKVRIFANGKVLLVDPDQVKLIQRKAALVQAAMDARKNGVDGSDFIRQIIKLNRRIRQNVIVERV